ncbi:MAG: hypothetical protein EOR85_12855 [Mesorhizobium sp.]|nr:hypothetical protein [Mesorhizobium sp.]RWK61822.1 MAG: hypothetical protein EOR49_16180 [Mesorhizobium sp.]RWM47659.1 MAG: hypothetical protein EOR76_14180 [Mesorhizobium sp.]RWN02391.1 MAG: hypothetical protein EOR85_12855 [Mesorhizobium sp.]
MLAATLMTTWAGPGIAEDQMEIVTRKFGEAMALGQVCGTLKANTAMMTLYTIGLGYTLDDEMKARIAVNFGKSLAVIDGRSEADACVVGEMLYGKKGTNAPGLLIAE